MSKLIYFPLVIIFTVTFSLSSCKEKGCTDETALNFDFNAEKEDGSCVFQEPIPPPSKLRLKFQFDGEQIRLNSNGDSVTVPSGYGAQTPTFNLMGVHYIEFSETESVVAYQGTLLYDGVETTLGGVNAIDFDSVLNAKNKEEFFNIDLSKITPGTYKYIRISVSYQNYSINFRANGFDTTGTIASFVGFNTYIKKYIIKNDTVTVNANKLQGYWGFETDITGQPIIEGQAVGTTVPNPIASTSPIPLGSCLVTGVFETPLVITGTETKDVTITCSFSINNSFEWSDKNGNNIYEPLDGDSVVDMGVRGLIPIVE